MQQIYRTPMPKCECSLKVWVFTSAWVFSGRLFLYKLRLSNLPKILKCFINLFFKPLLKPFYSFIHTLLKLFVQKVSCIATRIFALIFYIFNLIVYKLTLRYGFCTIFFYIFTFILFNV